MSTIQSNAMAAGKPVVSKYPGLGSPAQAASVPLSKMLSMVVGEANSGKSFIAQSNPDAYIVNCDESTVVYSGSEATMFPVPGPDGRAVGNDGAPIILSWEHLEEKRALLVELAKSGAPRPKTVVIDTLSSMMRLLKPWAVKKLNKREWGEVDGRAAYDLMFETFIEWIASVKRAGYGVCVLVHMSRKYVPVAENLNVEEWRINISDGFYSRLFPMFNVVVPITTEWETRETVEQQRTTIGGKETVIPKKRSIKARKFIATFSNPKLEGIAKVRTLRPLASVVLPEVDAWRTLEEAIDKASRPE